MLFENASQFQKAKQVLLENDRDIDKTARILKKSPMFSEISEGELICQLAELNEGLGDTIMNFLSGAFGGDVSKLKTVLTQMKEQELKYNREEYQIYDEFYNLLQDQKALDKDRENPNYQSLSRDIQQGRNALNLRFKELTKTHNEILSAFEQRVRDLTKDSNRKKKYFNAQRAVDVEETRSDRYEKTKAITARSVNRTKDLEDFFSVNLDDLKKESEEAKRKAEYEVEKLKRTTTTGSDPRVEDDPEQEFRKRFDLIKSTEAITARSVNRTKDLEDFFSVNLDDLKKESEEAKRKAEYEVEKLKRTTTTGSDPRVEDDPEQEFRKRFDLIKSTEAKYLTRRKAIFDLETEIYNIMMKNNSTITKENPHGDLGEENRSKLYDLYNEIEKYLEELGEKEKVKS
jgi:hypothetical protein